MSMALRMFRVHLGVAIAGLAGALDARRRSRFERDFARQIAIRRHHEGLVAALAPRSMHQPEDSCAQ